MPAVRPQHEQERSDYCVAPPSRCAPSREPLPAHLAALFSARHDSSNGLRARRSPSLLAGGVVGARRSAGHGRDASIAGRAAHPGGIPDDGGHGSRPDRTRRDHLHDPDGPGVSRGGAASRTADARRPSLGCGRRRRDRRPADDVGTGDVPHDLGPAGCPCDRPASRSPSAARAVFMTRPATTGEVSPTERIGDEVSADTAIPGHVRRAGQCRHGPSRHPPRSCDARQRPRGLDRGRLVALHVRPGGPSAAGRPLRPHRRRCPRPRRALLEPLSARRSDVGAPAVLEFGPVPDTHDVADRHGHLDPLHRADGSAFDGPGRSRSRSTASRSRARSPGRIRTPFLRVHAGRRIAVRDGGRRSRSAPPPRARRRSRSTSPHGRSSGPPTTPAPPQVTTPSRHHREGSTDDRPPPGNRPRPPKEPDTDPAVGGGSWADVETYYLGLMNCTRTGGWVTSSGKCSSPGGRDVAPLKLDAGDQLEGEPSVRQAAGDREPVQPLHRRQPGQLA